MNKLHGKSSTRLYRIWYHMKRRCLNPKDANYHNYGGRGITVCEEWKGSFVAFQQWAISNGYQDGLTLDRWPDNDGNYEGGNCRWATSKQQARNKRNNLLLTALGETKPLAVWLEDARCVVHRQTLWRRLKAGWSDEAALTTQSADDRTAKRKGAMGEVERQCKAWCQATGKSRMTYFRYKALGRLPDAA